MVGAATTDARECATHYHLRTAGTAWLDALDLHQLNDCPADEAAGVGFDELRLPPFDAALPTAVPLNHNASRGCCEAGWVAGVDFKARGLVVVLSQHRPVPVLQVVSAPQF